MRSYFWIIPALLFALQAHGQAPYDGFPDSAAAALRVQAAAISSAHLLLLWRFDAGGLLHILARDASGRKAGLRVVQVKE